MGIRTDLAMEAKALWERSAGKTTKLAGVRARERERDGFAVTDVHILDRRGEAALGKPAGRYVTLELPPLARDVRPAAEALAAARRRAGTRQSLRMRDLQRLGGNNQVSGVDARSSMRKSPPGGRTFRRFSRCAGPGPTS